MPNVKTKIVAFGKAKNSEYFPALEEFKKRLGKTTEIIELEPVKGNNPEDMLRKEEKILAPYFDNNYFKIILDGNGKKFSSTEFNKKLTILSEHYQSIYFFIGSSYGFSDKTKEKANLLLSLSNMTMPHLLARLILLEQIYRSAMITQKHPYHK